MGLGYVVRVCQERSLLEVGTWQFRLQNFVCIMQGGEHSKAARDKMKHRGMKDSDLSGPLRVVFKAAAQGVMGWWLKGR